MLYTDPQINTLTYTHTYRHKGTHKHIQTHKHTPTYTYTQTLVYTYTHTHTPPHTRTHRHNLQCSNYRGDWGTPHPALPTIVPDIITALLVIPPPLKRGVGGHMGSDNYPISMLIIPSTFC